VPRSTFHERVKDAVHHPIVPADSIKLTISEERMLEVWILDLSKLCKAHTYAMAEGIANILLAERPHHGNTITVCKPRVHNFVEPREIFRSCFSRQGDFFF
jgi:hypothetical protein